MLFYSADSETGGAGGLATVPSESSPNQTGGLLLDSLSENPQEMESGARQALNPSDASVTQVRVLVVDDHPDAADSLAAVLDLLGCPVRTCYDGESALALAAEFEPHVCLLDLMMPGMDGLELAMKLKRRSGPQPLLMIATTALGDWEARTRTALAGFHHHLSKPINIPELIEAITRLGESLTPPADAT
jgi:CheY-like chemotaxis protein